MSFVAKLNLDLYDLFPRPAGDTEVAVGGRLAEDRLGEAEALDDGARFEVEVLGARSR